MSKSEVFDKALDIIDSNIHLCHREIMNAVHDETRYSDQGYNKFLAIISSGRYSMREYIRKRRVQLAVNELIAHPEKTIASVAEAFGYKAPEMFSRQVDHEYGKSPSEIRKAPVNIPDIRQNVLDYIATDTVNSRLDAIFDKIESRTQIGAADWRYFETFMHATDDMGFDVSTCCLISELAEKLDIPFSYLIDQCFTIMIQCEQNTVVPAEVDEIEYMMDFGIYDGAEFEEIYNYYGCKYYEVTEQMVQEYREKLNRK